MNQHEVITTYYSEDGSKANVIHDNNKAEYYVEYIDNQDNIFYTEDFPGKSVHYVEDAAENWALGIKELNFTE